MPSDPSKWEMVDDATAEVLRPMTPGQRLAIARDLFQMARKTLIAQIENDRPEWTVEQVSREVARQISLGVEPPGCDLIAWLSRNGNTYGPGPWSADDPVFVNLNTEKAMSGT